MREKRGGGEDFSGRATTASPAAAQIFLTLAPANLAIPGPDLLHCGKSQRFRVITMGSFSLMHWVVVLFIILIIFGAGKLPRVMGDFAKGIKAFKSGMKEEETAEAEGRAQVAPPPGTTVPPGGVHAGAEPRPGERV
jgi:sec-independent protein translocase protein TatA